MTNKQESYNGWTNYATWRVNLEIIDGMNDWDDTENKYTLSELAEVIKETVEAAVFGSVNRETCGSIMMYDYADAFISDVNYYEIAQSVAERFPTIMQN